MTQKELKEMNEDFAGTLSMPGDVNQSAPEPAPEEIPVSDPPAAQKNITVYADKITACSYGDNDPVASFDIVFYVGVTDPSTGETKTHQVVKRIGVNKEKMAADAAATQQVSIVESKQPEKKPFWSSSDFRRLAGLK